MLGRGFSDRVPPQCPLGGRCWDCGWLHPCPSLNNGTHIGSQADHVSFSGIPGYRAPHSFAQPAVVLSLKPLSSPHTLALRPHQHWWAPIDGHPGLIPEEALPWAALMTPNTLPGWRRPLLEGLGSLTRWVPLRVSETEPAVGCGLQWPPLPVHATQGCLASMVSWPSTNFPGRGALYFTSLQAFHSQQLSPSVGPHLLSST